MQIGRCGVSRLVGHSPLRSGVAGVRLGVNFVGGNLETTKFVGPDFNHPPVDVAAIAKGFGAKTLSLANLDRVMDEALAHQGLTFVTIISFAVAAVCIVLAAFSGSRFTSLWWLAWTLLFTLQGFVYLLTTLRGKFLIWARLVEQLNLSGGESTLDVGCGRGMVLITTAGHLTTGQATGIDLWRSRDQSGNDASATQANAEANGVADRIRLETQDMSDLAFADESFDLVSANVAIQNLKDRELRRRTIQEIYRATKPGGRILIVDIQHVRQYRDDLIACGADGVLIRNLGPIGWFGNPFFASKLVSAHKP